jgi:hypothetical protein
MKTKVVAIGLIMMMAAMAAAYNVDLTNSNDILFQDPEGVVAYNKALSIFPNINIDNETENITGYIDLYACNTSGSKITDELFLRIALQELIENEVGFGGADENDSVLKIWLPRTQNSDLREINKFTVAWDNSTDYWYTNTTGANFTQGLYTEYRCAVVTTLTDDGGRITIKDIPNNCWVVSGVKEYERHISMLLDEDATAIMHIADVGPTAWPDRFFHFNKTVETPSGNFSNINGSVVMRDEIDGNEPSNYPLSYSGIPTEAASQNEWSICTSTTVSTTSTTTTTIRTVDAILQTNLDLNGATDIGACDDYILRYFYCENPNNYEIEDWYEKGQKCDNLIPSTVLPAGCQHNQSRELTVPFVQSHLSYRNTALNPFMLLAESAQYAENDTIYFNHTAIPTLAKNVKACMAFINTSDDKLTQTEYSIDLDADGSFEYVGTYKGNETDWFYFNLTESPMPVNIIATNIGYTSINIVPTIFSAEDRGCFEVEMLKDIEVINSGPRYNITGYVFNESGSPVDAARVTVIAVDRSGNEIINRPNIMSNGSGYYEIWDIPESLDVRISVYKTGVGRYVNPSFTMDANRVLNMTLTPSAVGEYEIYIYTIEANLRLPLPRVSIDIISQNGICSDISGLTTDVQGTLAVIIKEGCNYKINAQRNGYSFDSKQVEDELEFTFYLTKDENDPNLPVDPNDPGGGGGIDPGNPNVPSATCTLTGFVYTVNESADKNYLTAPVFIYRAGTLIDTIESQGTSGYVSYVPCTESGQTYTIETRYQGAETSVQKRVWSFAGEGVTYYQDLIIDASYDANKTALDYVWGTLYVSLLILPLIIILMTMSVLRKSGQSFRK